MLDNLSTFSILFLSIIIIYMYWGVYIIRLDSKSNTNRMFLLICISLSIWSLGFAMANSAINEEVALFWQRFSSLGWTTAYSIVLHFLLLLSHEDNSQKQKRLFRLLHIPAIISLYIFTFSNKIAPLQYNLLKTNNGWINKLTKNGWDTFFNIYYMSYMLIGILVVWRWQQRLENKQIANRAKFIAIALIASSIVGTFTDRVATAILETPLPQMGPLFILLPTWAMYHSARYYGVLKREKTHTKDIIVTEEDKKSIFNNLSVAFYVAAVFRFIAEYIPHIKEENSLKIALFRSLTLLAIGIIIRVIQKVEEESLKESLTIVTLVASIPIVLVQSLKYASVTVWAFPMIIIISSVIFSKRTLLISATIVSIISQALIWILRPEIKVVINKYDYMLRMGIFVVAFVIGLFISKIYVSKITENKDQINLQKMNLELSFDFADISEENFNEKMDTILSKIGSFFEVNRAYLYLIDPNNHIVRFSKSWCSEEGDMTVERKSNLDFPISKWMRDQLEANRVVYIKDVSKISDEASWERDMLLTKKVKSLLAIPIEDNGVIQGFMGIDTQTSFENLSEQKMEFVNIVSNLLSSGINKIEKEKEINFMAYYDNLTKLPNRFLLEDRVDKAIEIAKKRDQSVGIISMDLDNFKLVNDTMGHKSGDYLLKKVARLLLELVPKDTTVSRSGGDEFVILLEDVKDDREILYLADRIIELFSNPFDVKGRAFSVTASLGISSFPRDGKNYEKIIKNADIAMYEAKEMGKNQHVFCTDDMKEKVEMKMILSNDMFEAIDREEFVIHYQPQVDLFTGKINGLEALIRWNHPKKGMISPGVFIPLAEENGMINAIGEWVLKTACTQNKKWQDMGLGNLCMGVNLSAVQFIDANIARNIKEIIEESGLNPKYLELEITESIAIQQEARAEEILKKLKEIGIAIAIDDFGTEYSSLNRLKILPIDRIKIDMQFTQGIENNAKDREIIMVIIGLAKGLGMNVIAEGAETKEQIDFLKEKLCDDVQGYYYYKPMPAEEIEKILIDLK